MRKSLSLVCVFFFAICASVKQSPAQGKYTAFLHTAEAHNTFLNGTSIDHPATNNNEEAVLIVTQNWNPGGGTLGTTNNSEIFVFYDPPSGRWFIVNRALTVMEIGAAFNVLVLEQSEAHFVHVATAENTFGDTTFIDNDIPANMPSLRLLVTQVRPGPSGPSNDHPVAVAYDLFSLWWSIRNQDGADIPLGTAFNVVVASLSPSLQSHVAEHTSAPSNTTLALTRIDSELTNALPQSFVFITQDTSSLGDNPHPTGVIYDFFNDQWAVFNEDGEDMSIGSTFNFVALNDIFRDGFESGDTSAWSRTVP